jgi:hypothetical protein
MRSLTRLFTLGLLALALHQPNASAAQPSRDQSAQRTPAFRPALEAHLAAVSGRNLDALLPTLTRGNDLTLLMPDGKKLDTRQQFIDLHREWFASKDEGKWQGEVVRITETPALSHALVRYRYSSRQPDGKLRISESWLTLTFALEEGSWRLVFDQNTPISVKFAP